MHHLHFARPACALVLTLATTCALAEDTPPPYTLTGHIDLTSAYYLRGITDTYGNSKPGLGNKGADAPESDKPVLQWGADYSHESGFYLGYWASMINYSYKQLGDSYDEYATTGAVSITDFQRDKSIENDFYGGYVGKLGDWSYTLGMTGYYYLNGKHANASETKLGVAWKSLSFNAQTLLNDTVWGNRRDTYWTLNYSSPLPYDLNFTASLGWYTYGKEGKYLGTQDPATGTGCPAGAAFIVSGCVSGEAPVGGAFRHVILGLSRNIGSTGASWTVQGILGGENRFGVKQGNRLVGLVSQTF